MRVSSCTVVTNDLAKTYASKAENSEHYLKCKGVWSVAINTNVNTLTNTDAYVDATIAYILKTNYALSSPASSMTRK